MGSNNLRLQIAMWRWWSTYAHSFPLSYYRMAAQGRGTGIENPVDRGYISGTLELVTKMTLGASRGMRALFLDVPSSAEFLLKAFRKVIDKRRGET
jgi:hypothetical protein